MPAFILYPSRFILSAAPPAFVIRQGSVQQEVTERTEVIEVRLALLHPSGSSHRGSRLEKFCPLLES